MFIAHEGIRHATAREALLHHLSDWRFALPLLVVVLTITSVFAHRSIKHLLTSQKHSTDAKQERKW